MQWSNQIGPRGRAAWLLLVRGDEIFPFGGKSVPGLVAVVGSDYEQAGKWSHTTYRLNLAPGVRAISGRNGWETGTFREEMSADTWLDVANKLGVTLPACQAFLRTWRPKEAEHYDEVDAALAAVDDSAPEGADAITITIGNATRRQREAGFWAWPVLVLDEEGREVDWLEPSRGYQAARGVVRLLERRVMAGHGGGYVSLRVAAPAGCQLEHAVGLLRRENS